MKKNVEKNKEKIYTVHKNGFLKKNIVEKEKTVEKVEEEKFYDVENYQDVSIEDLIDPLNKYKYVEKEKKNYGKKFIYFFFLCLMVVLIFVAVKIINNKVDTMVENSTTTTTTIEKTTTIPTTKPQLVITETLTCSLNSDVEGITQNNTIISYFSQGKLQRNFIKYDIKLIDENYSSNYNQLVQYMILFALSIDETGIDVNNNKKDDSYELTIDTNLASGAVSDVFVYNEDYDSVLEKIKNMGYTCQ